MCIRDSAYNALTFSYADFSGRGYTREQQLVKPDIVAPGVSVISVMVGGGYGQFTGTSFATPFVTGGAALLKMCIRDRDEEALHKILMLMRHLEEDNEQIDMLISNYVYEKVGVTHKKCIHYRNVLPQDEVFRWDDIGHFRLDQYILMHSVIYRTDMLKLSQMRLPKHTFYVDNIYVYYPLPHVRKIYYLDVDFYLSLIHI